MSEFNDLTLSDIKVGGKQLESPKEPVQEPAATTDPAPAEPAPAAVTEPVVVDPAPADPAKVEPAKVDPTPAAVDPAPAEPAVAPTPAEYKFKDDFIKAAVEYYEKTGDLVPYVQAKTVDFTKLSDEEIMRRDLKNQYANLSDKAFDALYKEKVTDKFKIDEEAFGADAAEIGREFLKLEAEGKRQKFIEEQNSFKAPEKAEDKEELERQEAVKRTLEEFKEATLKNDETKSIVEGKRVALKIGEAEVNFEVSDPNSLIDMTLDNQKFFNLFQNADKSINYKNWYKMLAYSQNPEAFEKTLFDKGKAEGREEITKEIKNPTSSKGGDVPTDNDVDFSTGLLNAFAKRGKHS